MSFQPLPAGDDIESVSSFSASSCNQLVRPDAQVSAGRTERRRKALLAAALFSLIVFVASILGYGIFCLNASQFDANVSDPGPSSASDARVSTYALSSPKNDYNNRPVPVNNVRGQSAIQPPTQKPEENETTPLVNQSTTHNTINVQHSELSTPSPSVQNETKFDLHIEVPIKTAYKVQVSPESVEHVDLSSNESGSGMIPSKVKRSRNASRRRAQQGAPTLPPNATGIDPVSLLYEMRLNPKFEYFVCASNIQEFKTVLTINLQETKTYSGYGLGKKRSKKLAAQLAATDIYKPHINYTDPHPALPTELRLKELATNCGLEG